MKKSDLRTGMRVFFKNGRSAIVMLGTNHGDILLGEIRSTGYCDLYLLLDSYDENLEYRGETKGWAITSIYHGTIARDMFNIRSLGERIL